jgi:hypothetical protein
MSFKLSRDPALYLFLVATAVKLFSAFVLHVSDTPRPRSTPSPSRSLRPSSRWS